MTNSKPRAARPCAICQVRRVEKTKICEECMKLYGDRLNEPWAQYALEESDQTANLIRRQRRNEKSLEVMMGMVYSNE